ncbi:MAG: hypothetical protein M8467_10310 [Anaerolineae bacterium]|nr:hypothetical protein [Anaerolineae bacterium]
MMKANRYEIPFLVTVCIVAALAFACGAPVAPQCADTRTQGNDEFRRWASAVSKNGAAVADDCWHPLVDDDSLSADASGEAELNFSDCWSGRIFVFQDAGGTFRTEKCRKADYPGSATCVAFGSWYAGLCAGEFVVHTGSASIEKTGTSVSITYLPERLDVTLVVVLEGSVWVTPVDSFNPTESGPGQIVSATDVDGAFYFTMPLETLAPVGGLEPRRVYGLAELGSVAGELGIGDWMLKVAEKAREDGVLPATWPRELGGSGEPATEPPPGAGGFVVIMGGGALEDPRVVEGFVLAVDWRSAQGVGAPGGGVVSALTPDGPIGDLSQQALDPKQALALFDKAGYKREQPVTILYPEEDELLGRTAELVGKYLARVKVETALQPVPASVSAAVRTKLVRAGESVLSLAR